MVELARDVRHSRQTADVGRLARRRGHRHRCQIAARGKRRGRRCRLRIPWFDARRQVQLLQVVVTLFLSRKQFLYALQTFDGLRAHPVLHQDLGLQHQILQRRRSQRRLFDFGHLLFSFFLHRREPRCDYVKALIGNLAPQRLQPFLMPRLVGIHFRRPVQALGRLLVIRLRATQVKQLQQGMRVVRFAIRRVKQLRQKFQHFDRRTMRCQQFLHGGEERSPFPAPPLKNLQLPRQRHCLRIQLGVDHLSDQGHHLVHARRILFEHLPDQRLALHAPTRA